jgi:pimeloyl-ACP methyl ester carboxylesterase
MGGRVAQVPAAERPHLVDRLMLACTSPGGLHARERDNDVRGELSDPDATTRLPALHRLFYTNVWPHSPLESHLTCSVTRRWNRTKPAPNSAPAHGTTHGDSCRRSRPPRSSSMAPTT